MGIRYGRDDGYIFTEGPATVVRRADRLKGVHFPSSGISGIEMFTQAFIDVVAEIPAHGEFAIVGSIFGARITIPRAALKLSDIAAVFIIQRAAR